MNWYDIYVSLVSSFNWIVWHHGGASRVYNSHAEKCACILNVIPTASLTNLKERSVFFKRLHLYAEAKLLHTCCSFGYNLIVIQKLFKVANSHPTDSSIVNVYFNYTIFSFIRRITYVDLWVSAKILWSGATFSMKRGSAFMRRKSSILRNTNCTIQS